MDVHHNTILPCRVVSFLQIQKQVLIIDKSFPAKCFKSNKTINRAMSGSEATLHINKKIVAFKVSDKSTVDHSFDGFTDATCQPNRTIIGSIRRIYTSVWNRNDNYFPPIRRKVTRYPDVMF